MSKIQMNRGESSALDELALLPGEPAFALDTNKFYIGNSAGQKVLINPDVLSALRADKLTTERKIEITGDGSGSVMFDGSKNVAISMVLDNSGVVAGSYPKITVDEKGRVLSGGALLAADIPALTMQKITDAGTAAKYNVGAAKNNIPLLSDGGKLPVSMIPATAITDTFVVNTEAAMLALSAQVGDIAVRTDVNKSYILKTVPATVLANWQQLLMPSCELTSVNGRVGVVVLTAADVGAVPVARKVNNRVLSADITITKADVGLSAVTNEAKATMFTNPVFTGAPKSVTPAVGDNTTNIATTAFVKAQGYLTGNSTIDGGAF